MNKKEVKQKSSSSETSMVRTFFTMDMFHFLAYNTLVIIFVNVFQCKKDIELKNVPCSKHKNVNDLINKANVLNVQILSAKQVK